MLDYSDINSSCAHLCGLDTFLPGMKTKEQGRVYISSHFNLSSLCFYIRDLCTDKFFIISESGTIGINWWVFYICLPHLRVRYAMGFKFAEVSKDAEGESGKVDISIPI
uniref:Uncharacterized protein n=1 Tax=Micrurus lemniscatus lemniscatus TaxID=129467 RepID=A0A2D4J588_MICLE